MGSLKFATKSVNHRGHRGHREITQRFQDGDEMEEAVERRLYSRLVPFLVLLFSVAYLDRMNVVFAALQMQQQLGFTDAVYGLGAGMFFSGYFCFQVPSNLVLQRVGARRWIAAPMMVWGVPSSAIV